MRLIDADVFKTEYENLITWVSHRAEKARLREFIKDIQNQPTVKAIPIELIEKEMKRLDEDIKWAWYYGNTALDKMEYLKTWLTIKLEDWEKENERPRRKVYKR